MQLIIDKINELSQSHAGLENQVDSIVKEKGETVSAQEQMMEEMTKYQDNIEQMIERTQQDTDDKILELQQNQMNFLKQDFINNSSELGDRIRMIVQDETAHIQN